MTGMLVIAFELKSDIQMNSKMPPLSFKKRQNYKELNIFKSQSKTLTMRRHVSAILKVLSIGFSKKAIYK
jgi:hypothetical protein